MGVIVALLIGIVIDVLIGALVGWLSGYMKSSSESKRHIAGSRGGDQRRLYRSPLLLYRKAAAEVGDKDRKGDSR